MIPKYQKFIKDHPILCVGIIPLVSAFVLSPFFGAILFLCLAYLFFEDPTT